MGSDPRTARHVCERQTGRILTQTALHATGIPALLPFWYGFLMDRYGLMMIMELRKRVVSLSIRNGREGETRARSVIVAVQKMQSLSV